MRRPMYNKRTPETEQLYGQALTQLREGRWDAAVETLSELRSISTAYPEIDTLIADALLKIEVDRAHTPDGVAPPKQSRFSRPNIIAAACTVLVLAGAGLLIGM